jgi:hypothetical protein
MGQTTTVRASGMGAPWINFKDGFDVLAAYSGPRDLCRTLEADLADPRALASADFDEDGVADLLSGYAGPDGGILTIHRGNVDAIYPYATSALQRKANGTFTDAPFLSPALVYPSPVVPDFVAAGDFDGDGHIDAAVAVRGGNAIYVMPGDGEGGLRQAEIIRLPGQLTALASGDVNRQDGLVDLVASVETSSGPELLVFEGVHGGATAEPEVFSLPHAATDLAIGQLDSDIYADIAAACGDQLIVVRGRDRKLAWDDAARREVPGAQVDSLAVESALTTLSIGNFSGEPVDQVAALLETGQIVVVGGGAIKKSLAYGGGPGGRLTGARLSGLISDDIIATNLTDGALQIWVDDEQMQIRESQLSIKPGRAPGPVSWPVNGEPVAVLPMRLNSDALSDLVVFRRGHSNATVVPSQGKQIFVSNPADSGGGTLRDAINQANSSGGSSQIVFNLPGGNVATINLLSPLPSIVATVSLDATTQGNIQGAAAITPQATPGVVELNGGNSVSVALDIRSSSNVIRGFAVNRCGNAIQLSQGSQSITEGNSLGTDPSGTQIRRNGGAGVFIRNSGGNTVGGMTGAATNVISGNGDAIVLSGPSATRNQVQLNIIGTDPSRTVALGNNGAGVRITNGSFNNTIGGQAPNTGNLIFASLQDGVFVDTGSAGNLIARNAIDSNMGNGASMNSNNNTVGGSGSATNGVWRNHANGVLIAGSATTGNMVQFNLIGLNFDATGAIIELPNTLDGVLIQGASKNLIGGLDPNSHVNDIAFNKRNGVNVQSGNGNSILTDLIFANVGAGILLGAGANDDQKAPGLASVFLASAAASKRITPSATSLTVTGTVTGPANAVMTLQFYLGDQCQGSGGHDFTGFTDIFLNTAMVHTGADGTGTFSVQLTVPQGAPSTGFINATATNPNGSTSSFSQCTAIGTMASLCNMTCPPNQTVGATSAGGAVVNYAQPTLSSGCNAATLSCTPPSGSTFPIAVTTVNCSAKDAAGIGANCSFTVTVSMSAGPDFSLSFDQPTIMTTVGAGKTPVRLNITATGGFTGNVIVTAPSTTPRGIRVGLDPMTTTATGVFAFKVKVKGNADTGTVLLIFTVMDEAGKLTHSVTLTLIIN